VVLFAKQGRTVIHKNVRYKDSDHHHYPGAEHIPKYHDDMFFEDLDAETEEVIETTQ
jgi:hypothetical protein